MRIRVTVCLFFLVMFAGCATTTKGRDEKMAELQSRITFLETKIERNNQKISSLEEKWSALYVDDVVFANKKSEPSAHMTTKQIQTALKRAGFYKGAIDGKMGHMTREAIKSFQKANGLTVDGVAGKVTTAHLSKYLQ